MRDIWREQNTRLSGTRQLREFNDRLAREWAIETGIIEGLYDIDRGVTQSLIEHGFREDLLVHGSVDRPKDQVIKLLRDQQDTLDGVFDFIKSNRALSTAYIKELHAALVRSQTHTEAVTPVGERQRVPLIRGAWKTAPNSPTREGRTYHYCPPEHVAAEMDRLVAMHRRHADEGLAPDVQAAWLHHRFTQIHPFQDGNGRVARALASLVTIKDGLFPLVVTRDDRNRYLDALEAADRGTLEPLVSLFGLLQRRQFLRATGIAETILSTSRQIDEMLVDLEKAVSGAARDEQADAAAAAATSRLLEDGLQPVLKDLAARLLPILTRMAPKARAFVTRSRDDTAHYYRRQIVDNARDHLGYHADLDHHRAWVALNMDWGSQARLLFAFHGVGRRSTGGLICAPIFEIREPPDDESGGRRGALRPVAEEGFIFFTSESSQRVAERFAPWRDDVIKVMLRELGLLLAG